MVEQDVTIACNLDVKMSSALVKQSLELFQDDFREKDGQSKSKKKKTTEPESDPMLLISTNRKGVRKELRKLQKQGKKKHRGAKQNLSALELYDNKKAVDHTEASVKALQRISQTNRKDHKTADVIFSHHQGQKGAAKKAETEKTAANQSTVFTDDDFKIFEKDYFT